MGMIPLSATIHAHTGSVRVDGETQVGPIGVSGENSLLIADVLVSAENQLVVITTYAGIMYIITDMCEWLSRKIGRGPQVKHLRSRLINPTGADDIQLSVAANPVTHVDRRTGRINSRLSRRRWVIYRYHVSTAVTKVGEVTRSLSQSRYGQQIRLSLALPVTFVTCKTRRFCYARCRRAE